MKKRVSTQKNVKSKTRINQFLSKAYSCRKKKYGFFVRPNKYRKYGDLSHFFSTDFKYNVYEKLNPSYVDTHLQKKNMIGLIWFYTQISYDKPEKIPDFF